MLTDVVRLAFHLAARITRGSQKSFFSLGEEHGKVAAGFCNFEVRWLVCLLLALYGECFLPRSSQVRRLAYAPRLRGWILAKLNVLDCGK